MSRAAAVSLIARGIGVVLAFVLAGCSAVPQREWSGPRVLAESWSPRLADGTAVRIRPIRFGAERTGATIDYVHERCDPGAPSSNSTLFFVPRMIVVHWTATPTRAAAWKEFDPPTLSNARAELAKAGRLNVSAHFLVDRDGRIDQLLPETVIARHCIGLNRVAIGIENVGGPDAPLTPAQLAANASLVSHLAKKYASIRYLIGHFEYTRWEHSPLWEERDPTYRTTKVDPGAEFLASLRHRVVGLRLEAGDATVPVDE